MIDHPTFMYLDNPGNVTQATLTWWVGKEQFAVTNLTMTGDEREVHQRLLDGFVDWCNDRESPATL